MNSIHAYIYLNLLAIHGNGYVVDEDAGQHIKNFFFLVCLFRRSWPIALSRCHSSAESNKA